jgi:ABC-type amino acid transport system permease subunit
MSPVSACLPMRIAPPVLGQSRRVGWAAMALLAAILGCLTAPTRALAHGPVNPAASSYLATVRNAPAGLRAIVVDGDQRLWLHVDPRLTVLVLDYRGAPYLRFTPSGVEVNRSSAMYYSNQVPPEQPPPGTGPATRPSWTSVSAGHSYNWHDGRLHALAATALTPGSRYAGAWTIPLRVGGRPATISGGLRYAPNPSLVWFWPIVVALLCVGAGLRVRRPQLDRQMARALAVAAIAGVAVAGTGEELHGRPGVSDGQYVLLAIVLAFVAWAVARLVRRQEGWFGYFVIALAAIWEGASLIGVITHGFVLIALPPLLARVAVVVCLGAGAALLPVVFRLAEVPERNRAAQPAGAGQRAPAPSWEDEEEWDHEL